MDEKDNDFDLGIGSVFYPGILKIQSAEYIRSHGIAPDVCTIDMVPQSLNPKDKDYVKIEPEGYLIFQFDTEKLEKDGITVTKKRRQIVLQGCRVDLAAVSRSENSEVWKIPVFDRRWRWKFGSYSGHWNIKKNGIIEKRKEKTVRELADMCLEAMGEVKYETKALDELEKNKKLPYRKKVRPEVHWDRIPPAQALHDLLTPLGYRICLGWDEVVRICKFGEGALLPITDDLMTGSFELNLPETPSSISVIGNITMHEAAWELEAVGLDIDGEWKPINHLSYIPIDQFKNVGWHLTRPPNFGGLETTLDEIINNKTIKPEVKERRKEQLKLARETVFRCYRLKYPVGTKEDKKQRLVYDRLGFRVGVGLTNGKRRGEDKAFDKLLEKYEAAGRKLYEKQKPILPGPKQKNPKTGKLEDYELKEFEQVLPCFETRAELGIDPFTGMLARKPTIMTGSFYSGRKEYNTLITEFIQRDLYEIIPEFGIIKFQQPMMRMGQAKLKVGKKNREPETCLPFPADLRILIAVPLKSVEGEISRFVYEHEIPKKFRNKPISIPSGLEDNPRKIDLNVGTKVVVDEQITLAYQAKYKFQKNTKTDKIEIVQTDVLTNFKTEELEKLALAQADVELINLELEDGGSGTYAGLIKVNLDGALQQVAIRLDTQGGMKTTLSLNREVNITVPDFNERQRNQHLKEMIKIYNQTVDKTKKVKPKG
ncbi:hypothetical protein [Gimesia aquarii]|uniref:Uncharacterized protein n=1 Tax=Gimesia aquarii TaxID=2527964 RepID=A0A517VP11_9PLAN|nr:hypothetical protein [Gimesia aquarii]QDT94755.1 hypothetical protein V144x_01860 [Gimesia aquarii]